MPLLWERTNSVDVNPPGDAVAHLTNNGSSWLWAVFCVFALFDLLFILWTFFQPRGTRLFHHLAIAILTVSAIAHFAEASNLGFTTTATEFSHSVPAGTLRQFFWVRYVDWAITGPLLLLIIILITGVNLSDIFVTLVMFEVFWVCLLIGGLIRSTYKWGFFVFALAGLIFTWGYMFGNVRASAQRLGSDFHRDVIIGVSWLTLPMLLYAIAWACGDGGNVISVTAQFIWTGILDLITKPFFLIWYIFLIGRLDLARLEYTSGKFTDYSAEHPPVRSHHAIDVEKQPRTSAATADSYPKGKRLFSRKGAHDVVQPQQPQPVPVAQQTPAVTVHEPVPGNTTHVPGVGVGHTTHTYQQQQPHLATTHEAQQPGQPRLSEQTFVAEDRLG